MKKAILILAGTLLCYAAQAQWGVQAGLTFNNLKRGDVSTADDMFHKSTGFLAGVTYDLNLIMGLGINTGLLYVQRNVKEENQMVGTDTDNPPANDRFSNLELPLNLKYTFNIIPIVKPFATAGVYVDCGIGGKVLGKSIDYGETYNRWSSGLLLGLGVDVIKHIRVMYQYDMGLSDMTPSAWDQTKVTSRTHRLSLGFIF